MTAIITLGGTGSTLAIRAGRHGHIQDATIFALDSCAASWKNAMRNSSRWCRAALRAYSDAKIDSAMGTLQSRFDSKELFKLPYAESQTHGRRCDFSMQRDSTAVAELHPRLEAIAQQFDDVILAAVLGETDSGALVPLAQFFSQAGKEVAVFGAWPLPGALQKQYEAASLLQTKLSQIPSILFETVEPAVLRKRNHGYYPSVDRILEDDVVLPARALLEHVILQCVIYRIKPCQRLILGVEEVLIEPEIYTCQSGEAFVMLQARGEGGEILEYRIDPSQKHRYAPFQIGTIATNGYYSPRGEVLVNAIKNNRSAITRLMSGCKQVDIVMNSFFSKETPIAFSYISLLIDCCEQTGAAYQVLYAEPFRFEGASRQERFTQLTELFRKNSIPTTIITRQEYPGTVNLLNGYDIQNAAIANKLAEWRLTE